jgi:hypothetical protein
MEGAASIFVLLAVAGFAAFAGLGMLWGAGKDEGKEKGGMNIGKIAFLIVFGLAIAMWLAAPGTDQQLAGVTNAIWGNIVRGLQPLVSIAFQIALAAGVVYLLVLFIRRHRRRR